MNAFQRCFSGTPLLFDIRKAHRSGKLIPVIGAGVSASVGFPKWKELVKQVAQTVLDSAHWSQHDIDGMCELIEQDRVSNTRTIRFLEKTCGFESKLLEVVKKKLYSNPIRAPQESFFTSVCQTFFSPRFRHAPWAISYNFDDLIESETTSRKLVGAVFSPSTLATHGYQVPIYHVHGYLPRTSDPLSDNQVVLSERRFHAHYFSPYYWANVIQLDAFLRYNCLFLGISFDDPNLRRLLDHARSFSGVKEPRHFAFMSRGESRIANRVLEDDLESFGIQVVWIAREDMSKAVRALQSPKTGLRRGA